MKNIILLFAILGTFITASAQSSGYQFVYCKAGTDASPVYYFSDLFTVEDWNQNQQQIKDKFATEVKERGENINSYSVIEGLRGANTADTKHKANEFKNTIIQQDKQTFDQQQSRYTAEKRETFSSTQKTINLFRL